MELTVAVVISILGCVISVSSFVLGRKDKATKDSGDYSYKMGAFESKLDLISKQIDKILDKLDIYDREMESHIEIIDKKIKEAINEHIKAYHK